MWILHEKEIHNHNWEPWIGNLFPPSKNLTWYHSFLTNALFILVSQIHVFKAGSSSGIQFSFSNVLDPFMGLYYNPSKEYIMCISYTRYHTTHFTHITSFNHCSKAMKYRLLVTFSRSENSISKRLYDPL